jgi:methylmalonyl-CoA epimerase
MKIKRVEQIAIVVDDLDAAAAFYRDALGLALAHVEDVPAQGVRVAWLPAGETHIELLEPTQDDSGVAKFLAKRGPGIHHIALEVDDLPAMLSHLKGKGVRLINEEPVAGSGGKRVAFIHPESAFGVLIELIEE